MPVYGRGLQDMLIPNAFYIHQPERAEQYLHQGVGMMQAIMVNMLLTPAFLLRPCSHFTKTSTLFLPMGSFIFLSLVMEKTICWMK